MHQSSITPQIFDFIYRMVTAFIFDNVTVQTSNRLFWDFFSGLSAESPPLKRLQSHLVLLLLLLADM